MGRIGVDRDAVAWTCGATSPVANGGDLAATPLGTGPFSAKLEPDIRVQDATAPKLS